MSDESPGGLTGAAGHAGWIAASPDLATSPYPCTPHLHQPAQTLDPVTSPGGQPGGQLTDPGPCCALAPERSRCSMCTSKTKFLSIICEPAYVECRPSTPMSMLRRHDTCLLSKACLLSIKLLATPFCTIRSTALKLAMTGFFKQLKCNDCPT